MFLDLDNWITMPKIDIWKQQLSLLLQELKLCSRLKNLIDLAFSENVSYSGKYKN